MLKRERTRTPTLIYRELHCGPTNLNLSKVQFERRNGIWRIWAPPPNLQEIPVAGHSGPFEWAASPLLILPNQKYNPLGAPCITLRCHIDFNSYRENLLSAFTAFTVSSNHVSFPHHHYVLKLTHGSSFVNLFLRLL